SSRRRVVKTPVLSTPTVPTVGYTAQVSLLPQSKPEPPERWLSKGGPGTPFTVCAMDVRTSATAPAVLFVPTNAWWPSGLPLYLQGFPLPLLHGLPCHEWFVFVSVQLRERLTGLGPGVAVIAPPALP